MSSGETEFADVFDLESGKNVVINDKVEKIREPIEVVNQLVSEADNIAAFGVVGLKKLYFFDLKKEQIRLQLNTPVNPLGMHLSQDKSEVYVCYGESKSENTYIQIYARKDFFQGDLTKPLRKIPAGNGSHLSFYSLA